MAEVLNEYKLDIKDYSGNGDRWTSLSDLRGYHLHENVTKGANKYEKEVKLV